MKIIHCSDLHLDSKLDSGLTPEYSKVLRSELLISVRNMLKYAESIDAKAVIIAGDIFDTERITKQTLNYLFESFAKVPSVKIYILQGNHAGDIIFDKMEDLPENVFIFKSDISYYELDNVTITGIIASDEHVYDRLNLDKKRYNIVVMHGQESEYDLKPQSVNIPALRGKNIDYLALGHIHSYKQAALDDRGVYAYSGCLLARGFDECGSKGFIVLDTDSGQAEFTKLENQREFYSVDADITGLTTLREIEDKITEVTKDISERSFVKVILTGSHTIETQKDITALTTMFKDKFYFFKIYDKSKMFINIDDYKNSVSLKSEFIREVLDDNKLSDDEKFDSICLGIRALLGEDLD